jgi:hypothetical protein
VSTILKALRRLEEEKSRGGSQRPLREEVASGPGEQSSRRWTSWLPVLALLIGAGAGASAWWLWPYERTLDGAAELEPVAAAPREDPKLTPPPVALQPTAPAVPIPEPEPAAVAPGMEIAEAGPPEDAFASDVEVVDRPQPTPRIEPAPEPSIAAAAKPIPAAPPDPEVSPAAERVAVAKRAEAAARAAKAREKRVSASPTPTQVARAPIDAPPPAVIVPEPAPEPEPEFEPAPIASVPTPAPAPPVASSAEITVTRTQWHPERGRRSADVRFDGKSRSVHEGDTVAGYEVSEIKPSGVVLTRAGERVEQKIGQR